MSGLIDYYDKMLLVKVCVNFVYKEEIIFVQIKLLVFLFFDVNLIEVDFLLFDIEGGEFVVFEVFLFKDF